jgi:hypothetical protein
MILPETSSFRVSLKGTEKRDHMGAIDSMALSSLVPVSELVADADEGRSLGSRGVSISVTDVTFPDGIVEFGGKCHEETFTSLADTG